MQDLDGLQEKMKEKYFNHKDAQNIFWQLIEQADGNQEKFRSLIYSFSYEDLRAYQHEFFSVKLWTKAHFEVMEEIAPHGFWSDTRLYVISQGYTYYQEVSQDPSKLLPNIESDHPAILYYTIGHVIEEKFSDRVFDYTIEDNRFWQLIEKAEQSKENFYNLLASLPFEDLSAYKREFISAQDNLWGQEFPQKIEDYYDKNFDTVFFYTVSQGYLYYQDILQHPEKLPLEIQQNHPEILYEIFDKVIREHCLEKRFDYTNSQNRFWHYMMASAYNKELFYENISGLSLAELKDYEEEFDKAKEQLYDSKFREVMRNYTTDNGREDIAGYIVSQGYGYYQAILQNPPKEFPMGIYDDNPALFYGTIGRVMMDKFEDY